MKPFLLHLCFLVAVLLLAGCQTPPSYLDDETLVPPGSRVTFWVLHDDHGWVESNIHIAVLPRHMAGRELRRWAEGAGARDAGLKWTAYYVLVDLPGFGRRELRSRTYPMSSMPGPTRGI